MKNEDESAKEEEIKLETENENLETGIDDVSFEDVNDEGEVDARTTIKKLREKIKKLEGEKQEYLDLSQRTRADYAKKSMQTAWLRENLPRKDL